MNETNFEILTRYFEEEDVKIRSNGGRLYKKTEKGQFAPSNIGKLRIGIDALLNDGLVDIGKWAEDAGSGDGRVGFFFSGVCDIPCLLIEYDEELFAKSTHHLTNLRQMGFRNTAPIVLVHGNFAEDETYERSGIEFEDIGTLFNYWDNEQKIARRIATKSPPGTVFIYRAAFKEDFEGLDLIRDVRFSQYGLTPNDLHIYRKR